MVKLIQIIILAFTAVAVQAEVRFPTDGKLNLVLGERDVAAGVRVPIEVSVAAVASTRGTRIALSDMAKCTGPDYLCAEIGAIDIEQSASPGRSKLVSLDHVKHILALEFPQHDIQVKGPNKSRVRSESIEIDSQTIKDALEAVLATKLSPRENLRLRNVSLQMVRPIQAWPGEYRLAFPKVEDAQVHHLDWIVENWLNDKTWTVIYEPVDQTSNRKSQHRINASIEVEIQVPVARGHINRASVLGHEHFEYKWRRLGRRSNDLVKDLNHLVGLINKQAIRTGQPANFRNLDIPEVVTRGQKVKVHLRRTGLNLSTEGKALKSGGIGQTISVFYPTTRKTVQGVIQKDGTVEVLF